MILDTGKKRFVVVREVFLGRVNDVYVCRNVQVPLEPYKTVWLVKKHELAKVLLQEFEANREDDNLAYDSYECFSHNEMICFAFPYVEERPLYQFYPAMVRSGSCKREIIWQNLVTHCMLQGIPSGILYLLLKQEQVQLQPDGEVAFSFFLDLSEYDGQISEQENIVLCAKQIVELIELEAQKDKKKEEDLALCLLKRKIERKKYHDYLQLYQDIKIIQKEQSGTLGKKWNISAKIELDRVGIVLLRVCTVLVCVTLFVLIGYLLSGEFVLWKLFHGALNQIGTESLLQ